VNPVDPNRPGDVLETLFAGVLEAAFEAASDLIMDDAGNAHFARFRQGFEPGSYVHTISMYVAVFSDYIPEINADPKIDPLVARDRGVPFGHATLDRDRTGDGLDHAGKLDQQAIAGRLDDAAPVFGYFRIDEFASMTSEPRKGAGLILTHEAAVSGDISGEDGRQSALNPLSAHLAKPNR
jgi:hypothetical protein